MIAKKLPLESKRARNEGRGQKQTRVRGVGSKDEEKTGGGAKGTEKQDPDGLGIAPDRRCVGRPRPDLIFPLVTAYNTTSSKAATAATVLMSLNKALQVNPSQLGSL